MSHLTIAGLALAAAGLAGLVAAGRDCLRRDTVPALGYGTRTVGGGWMRAVWLVVLLAGYAAGASGPELVARERSRVTRSGAGAAADPATGGRSVLRVPFYLREASRRPGPDAASRVAASREAVTLPWTYLAALALYGVFVVWWPTSADPTRRRKDPADGG